MIEPISATAVIPLKPDRAFDRFVREIHAWWPREYTWSRDVLQIIGIEPRLDGLCFEIGPHGFRCDWGRVVHWAPPSQLRLLWQIGPQREPVPNPMHASSLTVSFDPHGPEHASVSVLHTDFAKHGSAGADYRAMMASEQGWPFILGRYADTAI